MTTHKILNIPASLDLDTSCLYLNCCDRRQLTHALTQLADIFDRAAELGADSVAFRVQGRVLLSLVPVRVWEEYWPAWENSQRVAGAGG